MDAETFNFSIRRFLKMVDVNSQREIEQAVVTHGDMDPTAGKRYLVDLARDGRYQRDR